MKKIISYALIIFILVLSGTGCKQNNVDNEETLNSLMDENAVIVEKIEGLSSRVKALEENNQTLLTLIDEQVTILSGELDKKDYMTLPIYHLDSNTYDVRAQYYVMMKNDWALETKVKVLAEKVSNYSFEGLPIDLLRIESLGDGKKIAVINLIDPADRLESGFRKTWAGNYFQGSTGGNMTTTKLIKTFLQEDFEGEWIDGVKFLYNNNEKNNFEHIGEFLGVIYLGYRI